MMSGAEVGHRDSETKQGERQWRVSPHGLPKVTDQAAPEDDTEADKETES